MNPCNLSCPKHLLLGLEVVEKDRALLRLLTPILDNNTGAVDNLAGVSFAIDLAYSSIRSQQFVLK
jgi:hypothetical protein